MGTVISNLIPLVVAAVLVTLIVRAGRTPLWKEAYRRIGRSKIALAALAVICLYGGVAVLDSIAWQDNKNSEPQSILDRMWVKVPTERTYSAPFAAMTTGEPTLHPLKGKHILGTDGNGRDVILRAMKGCRTAIIIGGLTSLIVLPIGLFFGLMSGYYGKRVDDAVQYTYTVIGSIPDILLLITLVLVLGRGLDKICYALGFTSWIGLCRLVRGETLKHREREYVRAARSLGVSNARIMLRHILPNLLPIVIITMVLSFSGFVMTEAILTYIGVGVPPEMGSWGNMIDGARMELTREPIIWWNLAAASLSLFLLVLSFNILGDAIRDAIDPRLRTS